jgi:hypothetical protein
MRLAEIIAALAATPATVRELLASAEDVDWKPQPDNFSLRENVCHLRDIDELGYAQRVVRTLTEDNPSLPDVDGAQMAKARGYATLPREPELLAYERSRAASVALLRTIDESVLARTAELNTVGRVTLGEMLDRWLEHDRGHIDEMRALVSRTAECLASYGA